MAKPKIRPLHVRPGARYRCFGDGLCCTNIHSIGPLSRKEVTQLKIIDPGVVHYSELLDATVMTMKPDGSCIFLGEQGCSLHTPMDGALKPVGCWRFPLGVTATPLGGRIFVEQRCPCASMGDRPEVTVESASESLKDSAGRVRANHRVDRVPLTRRRRVDFARYVPIETKLLEALRDRSPEEVLDREPFSPLRDAEWDGVGHGMKVVELETRLEAALRWVGDAILERAEGATTENARPWTDAFDRAEARTTTEMDPESIYRTFVSSHLWSLFWTAYATLEQTRRELATRMAIARAIGRRLELLGARPDRAAAEAMMIVDLVGTSEWWEGVAHRVEE